MALDPQNLPSDRAARQLARVYQRAATDLAHRIETALLAGSMATAQNRRRQLAAVVRYLDELGVQTDPMARQAVSQALTDGDTLARADVKRLGAQVTPLGEQTWHTVNREAAEAAGDQLTMELRNARQVVAASTNDLFRREAARETVRALTGVEGSPAAARRQLVKDLRARGLTAFVDRAGRRWKLQDYADMAVRTATRTAVVTGQIQRLAAHNIALARVSSHASACQICQPHEDRLIDITGTGRSEFLGEPVADGPLPPFHPRCAHTIMGVSEQVERLKRQEGTPNRVAEAGPSPSSLLGTATPDLATIRDRASQLITARHKLPDGLPRVPLQRLPNTELAQSIQGDFLPRKPYRIRVHPSADNPTMTLCHEFGHYLDRLLFGTRNGFGTHNPTPEMRAVLDALDATNSVKKLRQLAESGAAPQGLRRWAKYALAPHELFARAYAQWVGVGDPEIRELSRQRARSALPTQWSDDEFAETARALDALFDSKIQGAS